MGVMKRLWTATRGLTSRRARSRPWSRSLRDGSAVVRSRSVVVLIAWSQLPWVRDRVSTWPTDLWDVLSPLEQETLVSKFRQNLDQRRVAGSSLSAASDVSLAATMPAIHEYLTDRDSGGPVARQTATFTVFAEDGLFRVCLNDRQEGLTCWSSGETLGGAMEALEALLASGEAVWRRSTIGRGKSR